MVMLPSPWIKYGYEGVIILSYHKKGMDTQTLFKNLDTLHSDIARAISDGEDLAAFARDYPLEYLRLLSIRSHLNAAHVEMYELKAVLKQYIEGEPHVKN
jgi:hypothetical protein